MLPVGEASRYSEICSHLRANLVCKCVSHIGYVALLLYPSGGPYLVLSKQHTLYALRELKKEYVEKHRQIPTWMEHVRGWVLKHSTPKALRLHCSGSEQNRESSVVMAKLSRVMELYLNLIEDPEQLEKGNMDKVELWKTAIVFSGYKRPSMDSQLREWNGLRFWTDDARALAHKAALTLESKGLMGSLGSVRSIRSLVTPDARRELARRIVSGAGTLTNQNKLETLITSLKKDMLVTFHWRSDNPHLDKSKGV